MSGTYWRQVLERGLEVPTDRPLDELTAELTRMLGCEHTYDTAKGGWVPAHDGAMQTSVPGVYAAGDMTSRFRSLAASVASGSVPMPPM